MTDPIQVRLGVGDKYDLPWSWDSLDESLIGPLSEALVDWVLDYNENFVVSSLQLIPKCWPVHRGLAREIAAMYSHWLSVFHHPDASHSNATYFYTRALPPFQARIPAWLGPKYQQCQAGSHDRNWDQDVADRIASVRSAREETLQRLSETYAAPLAETRSSPEPAPVPTGDAEEVVAEDD